MTRFRLSYFVHERPLGWAFLAAAGWMLIVIAVAAFGTAASIRVLPHEVQFLNSTISEIALQDHAGNLVGFMVHNRVSFAGALMATGLLYLWLAHGPLRRGEAWAWWAFLLSGYTGASSFLSYFLTQYIDVWHGLGTLGISLTITIGLALTYPTLKGSRNILSLWPPDAFADLFSAFGVGRLLFSTWAVGMIVGGSLVLETGVVRVFVPEDLQFMRSTVETLRQIDPQVIPFVAHDRIGFGGALISCGIVAMACVWHLLNRESVGALGWLSAAWFVRMITAIGVHPLVGYVNLMHLLPFLIIDSAFLIGLILMVGSKFSHTVTVRTSSVS